MKQGTLNIGKQKIHYKESNGEGQPVLLIHGNSMSSNFYRYQFEGEPGRKYRLLAFDFPGHGSSFPTIDSEGTYSVNGLTAIIKGVAEAKGFEKAVFVGHSLGGHLAIESAAEFPGLKGMVIFGTPPLANPPSLETAYHPNPALPYAFTADLSDAQITELAGTYTAAPMRQEVFNSIKNTDKLLRSGLGQSVATGNMKDETAIVAGLKIPLAIFHGEEDALVNPEYFKNLSVPTLWRNKVHVISKAGHGPHYENPEAFNKLLVDFVDGVR